MFKVFCKMSTKLFVGNLPFSATEDQVRTQFEAFGEVISVALPTDRDTGRPRGFGFVEMDADGAAAAITALDGADNGGRPMRVNEARERPPRDGGGGGYRGGGGGGGDRRGGGGGGGRY